jgi:hypothetical protein
VGQKEEKRRALIDEPRVGMDRRRDKSNPSDVLSKDFSLSLPSFSFGQYTKSRASERSTFSIKQTQSERERERYVYK